MNLTPIEWTDYSANPLRFRDEHGRVVWACVHASPGCQHCYSEQIAHRLNRGGPFTVQATAKVTPFLDEREMRAMRTTKAAAGKRCFPFDMTDLFGEWVPDELLHEVFSNVLECRTDVTWQLLTKRIDRAREYLTWRWKDRLVPRHVWIGTSVEDQIRADERIPLLLQTPAAVRFISAEPLLEEVQLTAVGPVVAVTGPQNELKANVMMDALGGHWQYDYGRSFSVDNHAPRLDWVIVGGESGPKARPCDLAWIRSIVQQCKATDVPVFVKQLGAAPWCGPERITHRGYAGVFGPSPQGFSRYLNDRKGGDMAEWPEDLRIREYPR